MTLRPNPKDTEPYSIHQIESGTYYWRRQPVGVYYGGYAWVFQSVTSGYGKGIEYTKLTAGFKKETGKIEEMSSTAPGCACVFDGKLYLFGINTSREVYYTHMTGEKNLGAQETPCGTQ